MKNNYKIRNKLRFALPVLAGASAVPAHAVIVYTDLGPDGVTGSDFDLLFNLVDQTASAAWGEGGWNFDIMSKGDVSAFGFSAGAGAVVDPENSGTMNVPVGTLIDGELTFNQYSTMIPHAGDGNWAADGEAGYLGLKFEIEGQTRYGWALVSIVPGGDWSYTRTLHGFAYEDSGAGITAGAIPEPSTTVALTGLLAGSAAAFAARRRRTEARRCA